MPRPTDARKRSSHCVLLALLAAAAPAGAQEGASAEGLREKLTRFSPSAAEVLTVPEGIHGDFAVAKTPPLIDFAFLPGQRAGAKLWSGWGDAIQASDGNFYGTIGDHARPYGTAYVYRADPRSGQVELVVDFNRHLDVERGKYTPGKIHGPLMEGEGGWLYMIGYRGGADGTTEKHGYTGDWMLRYNVRTGEVQNMGIPVPYSSVPTSVIHDGTLLYGLNTPGLAKASPKEQFFVYDLRRKRMVFFGGPRPAKSRALILAPDGRAWYSTEDALVRYDPGADQLTLTDVRLPGESLAQMSAAKDRTGGKRKPDASLATGGILRAASRADANGIVYGITQDGHVFSFDTRAEKVRPITTAFVAENTATKEKDGRIPLYTPVVRLSGDGRYLYYIPSGHGGSRTHGTAVIQLEVATGRRKVLAFLNGYIQEKVGYNLGGTFGTALSEDGSQLFVVWNGSIDPKSKEGPDFGHSAAMIVHIPESERTARP